MEHQPQDLRFWLGVLFNGKWFILSVTVLALCIGLAAIYFQTFQYQSRAQIQIDPPPFLPNPGADLGAQTAYYWAFDRFFKTEKEKLSSQRLRELFAERLKSRDPAARELGSDSIGQEFAAGFRTEPIEDTNLLFVLLVTDNPDKSANWLNLYLDVYIEENARQQEENVKQSREVLRRQIDEIKALLASQQGSGTSQTDAGPAAGFGDAEQLLRAEAAYEEARRRRQDEEQKLTRLEPYLGDNAVLSHLPNFEFSAAVPPLMDRLAGAEATAEKLRREGKGPEHPAVKARAADVETLRQQILQELRKAANTIRLTIAGLRTNENEALRNYRQKQADRRESSQKVQEMERLNRARDAWANSMALVEDKLRSLNVMESFVANNVSIIERARPDSSPVYRLGKTFLVLVGLGGFVVGLAIVIAAEFLNPKVKTLEEIASSFRIPALGFLPRTRDFSLQEIRESYNVLRTEMLFRRETQRYKVVMVTSSIPQEGKTTVALNLAKTLAAGGDRTVVVDFDLRKARLRSLAGGGRQNGDRTFSPVANLVLRVEPLEPRTLHAIVPADLPPQPPFVLSQPGIRDFIDHLRDRYDWVVIDTPPVTSVTDPVIIASVTDSVLFVIKHDFVDRKLVRISLESLSKVNPNIMGAVLNDLDVRKGSYYRYQNYYRYYSKS